LIKIKVFEFKGQIPAAAFLSRRRLMPLAPVCTLSRQALHINCGKQCEQSPAQQAKCLIALLKHMHASFLSRRDTRDFIHFLTDSVDKIVAKCRRGQPSL
jgi:hypothetical protein